MTLPRYYFHVRHRSRFFPDEEGEELPGEVAMRLHAIETARDLLRVPSTTIPDWLECTLEVSDEAGRTVLTLPFSEAVEG